MSGEALIAKIEADPDLEAELTRRVIAKWEAMEAAGLPVRRAKFGGCGMSVTKRTYTITMITDNATGRTQIDKVNDGFDALQLLGLLDWSREDVLAHSGRHKSNPIP